MSFIREKNASLFIFLNALMWGSSYIWSKILLDYLPYFTILFLYSLGGFIFLTVFFFRKLVTIDRKTLLTGFGISMFSILSNISCMLALGSTSSSNTAFIVQMSVILTPLIMAAAERKSPGRRTVFSSCTAMLGTLLLTFDFGSFSFHPGDLFALANAVFFSLYIASQKLYAQKTDPVQFAIVQHIVSTAAYFCMAVIFGNRVTNIGKMSFMPLLVLALSIFISFSTILIQTSALKFIRPEKAAVIYTLEPVAAAVLAYFLIGERMEGPAAYAGCMLIIVAVLSTIRFRAAQPQKSCRTSVSRQPSDILGIGVHSGGSSSL
jgi:drug/metabolite transporter (DMT)-like permease